MRRQKPEYESLDSLSIDRESVPWYWRSIAFASSWLILGGFLILPSQFDSDSQLRVNASFLAIFAVALVTAGIALTGLTCYGVRNWLFHADAVFLPALSSCALGLLTVFYCFLISSRYVWNTGALLTTIAAAMSALVYGCLLFWAHRRISFLKHSPTGAHVHLTSQAYIPPGSTTYSSPNGPISDPAYYRNFIENMYPGARTAASGTATTVLASAESAPTYQSSSVANITISEEEATRQQMLLLLRDSNGNAITPQPAHNPSYHIDWDDTEGDDDREPLNPSSAPPQRSSYQHPYAGYYAPSLTGNLSVVSAIPSQAATPTQQQHLGLPGERFEYGWENGESFVSHASVYSQSQPSRDGLRPAVADPARLSRLSMDREARRRQIEMGM
ncbi:hypothetical protein MBLNU457_1828t1 [Dothideomycetes sp. NU457]